MNGEQKRLPGLYIHVPFCKTKCPYCGFYSVTDLSCIPAWLSAVKKELSFYRECFAEFDTVFLGGGTPTLLGDGELATLVETIFRSTTVVSGSEITVEANPDDITLEKLEALGRLGVNRISLGVQSFYEPELEYLQRRHTAAQAEHALDMIRTAGFANLGIDLMYGLKGQNEAAWEQSLSKALCFSPEHLSCYQLTIEEDTPFSRRPRENCEPLGEEKERSLFLLTSTFLEDHGYTHYEISNFARSDAFICRHNAKYWNHTPYLGIGPSAHSFLDNRRWWNVKSVARYCALLADGVAPIDGREVLTPEQRHLESLFLGFRTAQGIDMSLIAGVPGAQKTLDDLQQSGLVKIAPGRVVPTREGFLVADSLPLLFSR